jgi:hypothetical protein
MYHNNKYLNLRRIRRADTICLDIKTGTVNLVLEKEPNRMKSCKFSFRSMDQLKKSWDIRNCQLFECIPTLPNQSTMGFHDNGDRPFYNVSCCPVGSEIRERREHHFEEHNHNAKQTEARVGLTRKQAVDIFRLSLPQTPSESLKSKISRRPSAAGVAREYGVSEKTVRDIWTGRTWSELFNKYAYYIV